MLLVVVGFPFIAILQDVKICKPDSVLVPELPLAGLKARVEEFESYDIDEEFNLIVTVFGPFRSFLFNFLLCKKLDRFLHWKLFYG